MVRMSQHQYNKKEKKTFKKKKKKETKTLRTPAMLDKLLKGIGKAVEETSVSVLNFNDLLIFNFLQSGFV